MVQFDRLANVTDTQCNVKPHEEIMDDPGFEYTADICSSADSQVWIQWRGQS